MDLTPYVDHLRRELTVVAETGGEEVRAAARQLTSALESTTRLVLLEALSTAADEISRDLAPGSVEVRLRRRDPDFVVTPPPAARPFEEGFEAGAPTAQGPAPTSPEAEDGGTTRLSLRVPEHLKPRIEEAAGKEGLSVNAWLVRAVSAALEAGARPSPPPRVSQRGERRYTGWVR
ncbi:toxin-antitoxin system HicB family antitoxin [Streptosporangium sp. NPDC020145]|uniref:Toxin-antitoxin system HicB family antitoxin n=1 Tax=Streptosporangium jomthongense TaxID=1193683 RepID=A0ABV8F8T4_9ACTN